MTVEKRNPVLDSARANTDAPGASAHGHDISARINYQYEKINDSRAPGGTRSERGHTHDHDGDGRGILRSNIGAFYIMDMPLVHSTDTTVDSMGLGNPNGYEASGANYVLGVAYVSPGVETIRVEVSIKVDNTADNPMFRVTNLTDGTSSGWEQITTSTAPKWYNNAAPADANLAVTPLGGGAQKRIELDIEIKTDGPIRTFSLYEAFPFEYTDAP